MYREDTIAAIATPGSGSGIGVIRISGENAIEVADKIFQPKNRNKRLPEQPTYTIHYGNIVDGDKLLDEVIVLLMRGPHSYTAEDTVEIDCHGGTFVMRKILELVIRNGARPAEPGEFTKRAFLNGRIDLSQAEAVMDVIEAKNNYALQSSLGQLKGSLLEMIREMREKILYEIAYIESALDDPEHISLDGYPVELGEKVDNLLKIAGDLLKSSQNGRVLREGIRTVIVGKPNAGKSSLMNVLVGSNRAIVTDMAGTTRDILEEEIQLKGLNLNIVDTAGIRKTDDPVEKIGVERAKKAMLDADLILYVVDSSADLDENDEEIISFLQDQNAIILLNKADLPSALTVEKMQERLQKPTVSISAREETGMDELSDLIEHMFLSGEISFNDQVYLTNMRHQAAMEQVQSSLMKVKESISLGMPEDFFSIDLMDAYEALGSIIGESVGEDLVNEIFSKFCMGK
ncbi:MAG: tRNA uridine-5-carboxymethylaminomethyl(34) synthesis GTPase MnmE [Lachnospiraceae bacterium]|uniref:tRNA modification GTPase MnmE n=1 Tax=Hominiventricola filiformis TaxID=2885352 RepID=A0AAE3A8P8_9FIRM|nr:tRNA uridine-5-carboxymethylaminomethyl(34) synthesis GTPase MnmE [Hominiventricola filiformis]MCC2127584.1 tRNA uridine-5-carboxymethylaminomethyl(34) synthesis GTPase MnmE [Hominiventricola filiformis]MDY3825835.1 tRNA uridine-5-carboxymethylaminomethyl(34) synthesis GTPase MnmE [Lachnospiraceae bacterium]QUO23044.1 tRNA uridine-5-carboxymethylaminomethyl(34) synthesis GTPase MnmE [Clostridiaceae bacterium Marseille-Q4143]